MVRHISNVLLYLYLLREEGRRRVRVEVPREEAVDQLGLQGGRRRGTLPVPSFLPFLSLFTHLLTHYHFTHYSLVPLLTPLVSTSHLRIPLLLVLSLSARPAAAR